MVAYRAWELWVRHEGQIVPLPRSQSSQLRGTRVFRSCHHDNLHTEPWIFIASRHTRRLILKKRISFPVAWHLLRNTFFSSCFLYLFFFSFFFFLFFKFVFVETGYPKAQATKDDLELLILPPLTPSHENCSIYHLSWFTHWAGDGIQG